MPVEVTLFQVSFCRRFLFTFLNYLSLPKTSKTRHDMVSFGRCVATHTAPGAGQLFQEVKSKRPNPPPLLAAKAVRGRTLPWGEGGPELLAPGPWIANPLPQ